MDINVGKLGEKLALDFLKEREYEILERNFRSRFAELDIVAKKDGKITFFEVKTRIGTVKGKPYEAVNYHKIIHLKRAIEYFLLKYKIKNYKLSLDLISIILNSDLSVKEIKIYENIIS